MLLLQAKAKQLHHAKKDLQKDLEELKNQLEHQREHRIGQEQRVRTPKNQNILIDHILTGVRIARKCVIFITCLVLVILQIAALEDSMKTCEAESKDLQSQEEQVHVIIYSLIHVPHFCHLFFHAIHFQLHHTSLFAKAQTTIKVYSMNSDRLQRNLETSGEENTLLKESNDQV